MRVKAITRMMNSDGDGEYRQYDGEQDCEFV